MSQRPSSEGERLRVTHLHNVIIKQQPEAMTLHDGDVMTSIWPTEETQTEGSYCTDDSNLKLPHCTASVPLCHLSQ